jgi:hypothetical protein
VDLPDCPDILDHAADGPEVGEPAPPFTRDVRCTCCFLRLAHSEAIHLSALAMAERLTREVPRGQ